MSILLYTDLRTDDYGNQQYNTISNEQKKIINNIVLLDELPEAFTRVVVTPPSGDETEMIEIDLRQPITNVNQYKVNYNSPNAVVYFHPDREGQTMHFAYTGMGLVYIDGSRVVTLYENGTIRETLNQLVETLRQTNLEAQENETTRLSNETTRQSNELIRLNNELARQQLKQQVETETLIIYKNKVTSFSAISTTYPSPQVGWVTQTSDTGDRYRFNGTQWINIGTYLDSGDIIVSTTIPSNPASIKLWIDIS